MSEVKRASFAQEDMKEGGGNLFGSAGPVRATVIGGRFTKEAPDNYTATGNPIFAVVDLEMPGDAPIEERRVNQSFSLGAQAGDHFTVSADGDYLTANSDDAQIIRDCKFGILASSLQNEGVPKTILADFAFSKLVGLDGDWKRIADKARTFNDDKPTAGKKKFPPSTLCLVKLHALPGTKAVAASTKPAASTAPISGGDLDTDTWTYLQQVLTEKGGTEQRGRLTLAVSKAALKDGNRQAIARRAGEESFLNSMVELGMITYAAGEKGQPVTIVT